MGSTFKKLIFETNPACAIYRGYILTSLFANFLSPSIILSGKRDANCAHVEWSRRYLPYFYKLEEAEKSRSTQKFDKFGGIDDLPSRTNSTKHAQFAEIGRIDQV